MKNLNEFDLMEDLVKLLKKYGPEPFCQLAKTMSEPNFSQSLIYILDQTVQNTKNLDISLPNRNGKQKIEPTIQKVLLTVKQDDIEKHDLLQQILSDLRSGLILPTMKDIRYFSNLFDLSNVDRGSRTKSIVPLVRALAKLSTEEIKEKEQLFSKNKSEINDLEKWSNLILRSSNKGLDGK